MLDWKSEFGDGSLGKFASSESARTILSKGSLKWTRPGSFNDPFDCQIRLNTPIFNEEIAASVRQAFSDLVLLRSAASATNNPLARNMVSLADLVRAGRLDIDRAIIEIVAGAQESLTKPNRIGEYFTSELERSKVLCLTKAFENILMWSHYADCHRGVLIVFSPDSHDSQFRLATPVNYSSVVPPLLQGDEFSQMMTGQLDIGGDFMTGRIIDRVTLTKSIDWSYEREWRIVGGEGIQADKAFEYNGFERSDVRAVVFGARHDPDIAKTFMTSEMPFNPSKGWYRAEVSKDRFSLDLVRL